MSDIPSFPYAILWEERQIVSVANLTRRDAVDFLTVAPQAGVKTQTTRYPLAAANEALADLRDGRLQGAAVLVPWGTRGVRRHSYERHSVVSLCDLMGRAPDRLGCQSHAA